MSTTRRDILAGFALGGGAAAAIAIIGPAIAQDPEPVVKITVKKFEFTPKVIELKRDVPVILEITTLDRLHGFNLPDLKLRASVFPGKPARLRLVPDKAGTFVFRCDIFCGNGHEGLTGQIVVA